MLYWIIHTAHVKLTITFNRKWVFAQFWFCPLIVQYFEITRVPYFIQIIICWRNKKSHFPFVDFKMDFKWSIYSLINRSSDSSYISAEPISLSMKPHVKYWKFFLIYCIIVLIKPMMNCINFVKIRYMTVNIRAIHFATLKFSCKSQNLKFDVDYCCNYFL